MDEIKELVEIKIGIYTGLYNTAKERDHEGVANLYAQHLRKLKELIKILNALYRIGAIRRRRIKTQNYERRTKFDPTTRLD